MTGGRFRWVTVQRALDVLEAALNNAQMVALIEELGAGPDYDRTSTNERTTPKLRNLLSRVCREEPARTDTEGERIDNRVVQLAARQVPSDQPWHVWDRPVQPDATVQEFLNSLAVDGWTVVDSLLVPVAPSPTEPSRLRIVGILEGLGANEALRRLEQAQGALDGGHWESVNASLRGFLNAVFEVIADRWPETSGKGLREGDARKALEQQGFFRADPRSTSKSLEGDLVRALLALFGSEGSHTGSSDPATAAYRFALAILTADYFLGRLQ